MTGNYSPANLFSNWNDSWCCYRGLIVRTPRLFIAFAIAVTLTATLNTLAQTAPRIEISGSIVSGQTKLPGAVLTATSVVSGESTSAVSDDDGRYLLVVSAPGTYLVRVELFGFSPVVREVSLKAADPAHPDFRLALAPPKRDTAVHPQGRQSAETQNSQSAREDRHTTALASHKSPSAVDQATEFSVINGPMADTVSAAERALHEGRPHRFPVHLDASYEAANSALDASPYALHGIAVGKPEYADNSFGATVGGALPWLKKGTTRLSAGYSRTSTGTPFSGYATVPTAAMRLGDFSAAAALSGTGTNQSTIFDPKTGEPFPGNRIPLDRINQAAGALLAYFPMPKQDGAAQNFHFVSATRNRNDAFSVSLSHAPPMQTDNRRNAPFRNSWTAALAYHHSTADAPNIFPSLGGNSISRGSTASISHTLPRRSFANSWRLAFDLTWSRTLNRVRTDVAANAGIAGVSHDRFDWGLPAIDLAHFTGLRDVPPGLRADQNLKLTDAVSWTHGKHNLKWGGEVSRLNFRLRRSNDASGAFAFTGFATAQFANGVPVPGTGSDFADFLLGLPQKTHVQFSDSPFSFTGHAWSVYVEDDWRVSNSFTVDLGVRYEYVSPFSEAHNRLATLDVAPDVSEVRPIRAGHIGPFTGRYPRTIVSPDTNNVAPRIGIAWRAAERLVVRVGYSISYDPSVYNMLATRLAFQAPFAVENSGIANFGKPLTLQNGFHAVQADTVTNSFAVRRSLPLGYAQVWVLELENELPAGLVLVTSYTGTKGAHLALLRAPNRSATGLLLPEVAPFLLQTGEGSSMLNAASVRVQKALAHGLSFGATYMLSRSVDNDPALGDDIPVAQDDSTFYRDRGLSAFDQRHRLTIDYQYVLPFGRGRPWLSESAVGDKVLGGWSVTGALRYASGSPFTPHVVGDYADDASGGYGALRPDLTGEAIQLTNPTVDHFFNVNAFRAPSAGQYGNAGRNTITGPHTFTCDASVTKSFVVAQQHSLEFQAQITNLLNTPEYTHIDSNVNSPTYGQITNVGNMRAIR